MLSEFTGRLAGFCARRAVFVVCVAVLLTLGSIWAARYHLAVTTDTKQMFSSALAWKKRSDQMGRDFPQQENLLVAVIKAETPEEGEQVSHALVEQLSRDHAHFLSVRNPARNDYLSRYGALLLPKQTLQELLDQTIMAQPFLGTLAQDPSIIGINSALSMMAMGVGQGQVDLTGYKATLDGFADILESYARGEKDHSLSWQSLISGAGSELAGPYQFVLARPKLEYDTLQPAGAAAAVMRAAVNNMELVKSGRVKVHFTGDAQISDEEFTTVFEGMVGGLVVSLVLVTLWLFLAVVTWRVVIPILLSLVGGLLLTTGAAALMVGTLNLISVAFAILFVGIAVDFLIQFSVRFRTYCVDHGLKVSAHEALVGTGREAGPQIAVASFATAAGFLAFVPTDFVGVAQLGLIAGCGMLIAFLYALTLLPALLYLFHPAMGEVSSGFGFMKPVDHLVRRYRVAVLSVFGVLAVVAVVLVPRVYFDGDPLHTKDPDTEGMRTLALMMNKPETTPYTASLMVYNEQQARTMAERLSKLPLVKNVVWLGSFIPEDQAEKLAMVKDAAGILLPTLHIQPGRAAPDARALRASVTDTADELDEVSDQLPDESPLHRIAEALEALSIQPDGTLIALNQGMMRYFPAQIEQLKALLQVDHPATLADIPPAFARDYRTPEGHFRLDIQPREVMSDTAAMRRFVAQLRTVAPDVTGSVVDIVESADTIVRAFITAALSALGMIALILVLVLRRVVDTALVLASLILSALMTVILVVLAHQPLNFANIIALPLLLGVGVSFNIYFVMNWREGLKNPLSSPTARAVLFSALTTGTAFGSLAGSYHPGTASMGRLLLLSLFCTLVATLVFIPALLPRRAIDEK